MSRAKSIALFCIAAVFLQGPLFAQNVGIIEDFTWMGMTEDRVGSNGITYPDGTKDGQFRITLRLEAPAKITMIKLENVDERGNYLGSYWQSGDYGHAWILGVYLNDRLTNSSPKNTLSVRQGQVSLDLFANDANLFREGNFFEIEVTTDQGVSRQTLQIGRKPEVASVPETYSSPAVEKIVWKGLNTDRVGPWSVSVPDGFADSHFEMHLQLPPESVLGMISVHLGDASGNRLESYWFTDNTYSWILGAFHNGIMLNSQRESPLGVFSDDVVIDLFAANDGNHVPGNYFHFDIEIEDEVLTHSIQLK